jgi:hypothetical protein
MTPVPARRRLGRLAGRFLGVVASVLALASVPALAAAQVITDPVGDFRAPYVAAGSPAAPSLDLIGGGVGFTGDAFIFTGVVNGRIVPEVDPDLAYVFGVNRGAGTARLTAQGVTGANNVLFDATVTVRPNGSASINLFGLFPPIALPGVVTVSDNVFFALVPVALLPSRGFAPPAYTFSLWSRIRTTGSANAEIADFAPENATFGSIAVVPEPATALLVAPALLGLAAVRRRGARAAA